MIDTIVLTLCHTMFSISNPKCFRPSADWIMVEKLFGGFRSIQNPTKKELLSGIYKPRLTLSMRPNLRGTCEPILRIELSLPKLFFGNNFAELQLKDFLLLAQRLVDVLLEMGVKTSVQALAQAPVASIHYSKNIALTDGSTPYHYIQKIKEANISLSLDTNQTDYRNDGYSFKWHANTYEVAFYDKIKDLEKAKTSEKRTLEKDNALQLSLLSALHKHKKLEILRMEVRLNTRKKIKQLCQKLGIKADLTFKKLFKPAISKKILLYYLNEIESKRPLLLDYKASDAALLADLMFNNPTLSPKQILQFYGLKHALAVAGARGLRMMLAAQHKRSWHRLMADAAKVVLPIAHNPIHDLKTQLLLFKPLKTDSYKKIIV